MISALIVILGAAMAAPSHLWAADAPTMSVRAGVGGIARPGRWLPVEIDVRTNDAPFRGTVTVAWGAAISRRDVLIAAADRVRVSAFVRTIAASPGVRVSLIAPTGRIVATIDTPLTLVPTDAFATLCVGDVPAAEDCTTRLAPHEVPTNARAFEFADRILWAGEAEGSAPARAAVALARAAHWWRESGAVDPVVAPFDTGSRSADRTSALLGLYIALLVAVTATAAWRRAPAPLLLGLPLLTALGALLFVSRSPRDLDIQGASFVHQFAGVPQSIVVMNGEIEHPGAGSLDLMPELTDASVDVVRSAEDMDSASSSDGRAMYRHTAGRGVRQRFEINGTLDAAWLRVTRTPEGLDVVNDSPFVLTTCELRSVGPSALGDLQPGGSVRIAESALPTPGDEIVCRLPASWLGWSAANLQVRQRGTAFLLFHVPPQELVPRAAR